VPAKQHIPLCYHGTAPLKVACKLVDRKISVARQKLKIETVFHRDHSAAISMQLKWKDFRLVKSRPLPLNYSRELSLRMSSTCRHVDRCLISLSLQFQPSESTGQVTELIQFCLASLSTGVKLQSTNVNAPLYLASILFRTELSRQNKLPLV
jgi:hypothetical protein